MINSQLILFELLKVVLHASYDPIIPYGINWENVYHEAEKNNLVAVVWDAIKKMREIGKISFDENERTQILMMRWYGMANLYHKRYAAYVQTIKELSQIYQSHGLQMMILKGYGCSLNYPDPQSRPCGDIDIWMYGKHKEADILIQEKLGLLVHEDNDHHSVFNYDGFTIENHNTILDINTHTSSIYLNRLLENIAREDSLCHNIDDQKVYFPSVRFNSIHLLRHMASDFATVSTSLRHILDWSTFINANSINIDWNFIHEVAHNANMHRFLDAINSICIDYLGYSKEIIPVEKLDIELRERVLNEILNNHDTAKLPNDNMTIAEKINYGIAKTIRFWKNRWKYRIVYDESLLTSFYTLSLNRLLK